MGVFSGYTNPDGGQLKTGVGLASQQLLPIAPDYKDMELEEVKQENVAAWRRLLDYLDSLKNTIGEIATAVNDPLPTVPGGGGDEPGNSDIDSLVRCFDTGECEVTASAIARDNSWSLGAYDSGSAPYEPINPTTNRAYIVADVANAPTNPNAHWVSRDASSTPVNGVASFFNRLYVDRIVNTGTLVVPLYLSAELGIEKILINGVTFYDRGGSGHDPEVHQLYNLTGLVMGSNKIQVQYGSMDGPGFDSIGLLAEWGTPTW